MWSGKRADCSPGAFRLQSITPTEVSLIETNPTEVDSTEVGLREVGLVEVWRDISMLLPPLVPRLNTLPDYREMLLVRHCVRLPLMAIYF
jgi:hypothetical protein